MVAVKKYLSNFAVYEASEKDNTYKENFHNYSDRSITLLKGKEILDPVVEDGNGRH